MKEEAKKKPNVLSVNPIMEVLNDYPFEGFTTELDIYSLFTALKMYAFYPGIYRILKDVAPERLPRTVLCMDHCKTKRIQFGCSVVYVQLLYSR